MDYKNVISLIFFFFCTTSVAQRQLIVLKNEQVLMRYQKGDIIKFKRAQDKEIQIQRILDLNDTLIMMNFDSVAYYRIEKLDIRTLRGNQLSTQLGIKFMIAGVLLPLIDLFNTTVIQDDPASVSEGVWITSAALIGTGAALTFIKKPYFKPGRKYHMIIIDKRSPFYKEHKVNPDPLQLELQDFPKN
jgi:hypothetical protein